MKYLYANGDSFVFGMECIKQAPYAEENKEYAFPKHLANLLSIATYINNAYNGATNEFIFRNTLFDLIELEKKGVDPTDVFVVVGWTSLFRTEVDGNEWFETIPDYKHNAENGNIIGEDMKKEFVDFGSLFVNPSSGSFIISKGKTYDTKYDINPFCVKYLWNHSLQNPQQEARVIALDQYLKSKGYRYLFVNTCGFFDLNIANVPKNFYMGLKETFYSWAVENYPAHKQPLNHFDPVPHEAYGKILFDYVSKHKL